MVARKLVLRYLCHSVACVVLLVCFATLQILDFFPIAFVRGFYCNDETILYPFSKQETVPVWALIIYILSLPMAVIICCSLIKRYVSTQPGHRFTTGLRTCLVTHVLPPIIQYIWYLIGLALLVVTVDCLKLYMGELRPQFIHGCDPDFSLINCTSINGQRLAVYVTDYQCRGDPDIIKTLRLSFPSGHSASSIYAGVFTILYLSTIPLPTQRSPFQLLIMVVVLLTSVLISVSRIVDRRHHPHDVIFGVFIGAAFAIVLVYYNLRYFGKKQHNDSCKQHFQKSERNAELDETTPEDIEPVIAEKMEEN